MKSINKILIAGLMSISMLTAMAQPAGHPHPMGPGPDGHDGCPMQVHMAMPRHMQPVDFQRVATCYLPETGEFVVVDSIDCSVDIIARGRGGEMQRVGRYVTDNLYKRHDLKNILRPVSVSVIGRNIIFVASSVNDSSYIGVLGMEANAEGELPLIGRRDFSCCSYAMEVAGDELVVAGRNPLGYDYNILSLSHGIESLLEEPVESFHYRVPKQSERIKQSDPVGVGLTAVAVSVVFLALVCIALILQGSSKLISGMGKKEKKSEEPAQKKGLSAMTNSNREREVAAAIAAAIHLYNEDLHDEEDTVITIQKVEREWTPWNAKYYNMNHYFNNRK